MEIQLRFVGSDSINEHAKLVLDMTHASIDLGLLRQNAVSFEPTWAHNNVQRDSARLRKIQGHVYLTWMAPVVSHIDIGGIALCFYIGNCIEKPDLEI